MFNIMKRVFLGIDLPQELKSKIEKLKKQRHLDKLPIKLVEPINSHIAVKFLDELDDNQIQQIDELIKKLTQDFKPFDVTVSNSLVFPNSKMPRVLALKIVSHGLENAGNKIINKLGKLPFVKPENRKYTPHITLGRIKGNLNNSEKNKIADLKFIDKFTVDSIQLFESQLTGNGPIYTVLKEYNL